MPSGPTPPTPNAPGKQTPFATRPGFERLEPRLLFTAVPVISEFLASNDSGLQDEDGERSDWIELYNAGNTALDLTGWHLTDDAGDLNQWAFPSVSLDPGAFLLVFASGKNRADADGTELHTSFKLGAGGEYLALVEADGSTVAFEYAPQFPTQMPDVSYGLAMTSSQSTLVDDTTGLTYLVPTSGTLGLTWTQAAFNDASWTGASGPTLTAGLGYESSGNDYDNLIDTTIPSGIASVYARFEFNLTDPAEVDTLDLGMIYDDGFVAYLNGVRVAASDNAPASPVWNSTTNNDQRPDSVVVEDYVSFDISEHRGLLQAGNNVLAIHGINASTSSSDMLLIPRLLAGEAELVSPHADGFFSTNTPGGANGQSFQGFVGDTSFTVDRGFFTSAFDVEIEATTADAMIVYTTDGSAPTVNAAMTITNGTLYTGAIHVSETSVLRAQAFKAGFAPTNVDTQTYIFAADVISQDFQHALDQGLPSAWGPWSPDYGINVVNGHEQDFIDALTGLPTLSIVTDADFLFGSNGIYTNSQQHGQAWERPISFELINPDGSVGFQEDAGLRIQGGTFRYNGTTRKNSLRVVFRDEYGAPKLLFPFFGEDATDEFDNIVLRMESNDGWQWSASGALPLFARDEFLRETQLAMGQPSGHGRSMHVYINGVYWGLYNAVERPDESFGESYIGGDKDNYDVINSGEIQEGSADAWNALVALAQSVADAGTEAQRTAALYELMGLNPNGTDDPATEALLDVDNYIDYLLTNMYGANGDWPFKNYRLSRDRGPDSEGFKFFLWDAESTLGYDLGGSVHQADLFSNRINISDAVAAPYDDLRDSAEFRLMFADRVHQHMFNGGALTVDIVLERFDRIIAEVALGLWAESGRWGDQHTGTPRTPDVEWANEVHRIRTAWLPFRTGVFLDQLIAAGLYSSVTAVTWNQRGGEIDTGFNIQFSIPNGQVYYTTDGSDPRMIGGAVSQSANLYLGGFSLSDHATVRARVFHNGVWSAIDQADFVIADTPADATNLRVSELHYNPAGPSAAELAAGFTDGDQFEFIELINTSGQTISLDGVQLARTAVGNQLEGITFTFGLSSLAPGERIVVVSDLAAFTERYGSGINVAGEYAGNLANSGETLHLKAADGSTIQSFYYDDDGSAQWPTTPDGDGPSLVIINTDADYSSGSNWTASSTTHGTPGAAESASLAGDVNGDGFVGIEDLDLLLAYWGDAAASSSLAAAADLNDDGTVNSPDLSLLIANWGAGTPPLEPTSNDDDDAGPGNNNSSGGGGGEGNSDSGDNNPTSNDGVATGAGDDNSPTRPTRPTRPIAPTNPTRPTRPTTPGATTRPTGTTRPANGPDALAAAVAAMAGANRLDLTTPLAGAARAPLPTVSDEPGINASQSANATRRFAALLPANGTTAQYGNPKQP